MQFTVQLFLDGTPIDPSEVPNLIINSPTVQRIVNRAAQRYVDSIPDHTVPDADRKNPLCNVDETKMEAV